MGGLYFAFSTFIMAALGRLPPAASISAMQSINSTILASLFAPLFFGTTLSCLVLIGVALFRWDPALSPALLAASLFYVIGMFGCTILFNVPLNNLLAAADPTSAKAATVWDRYLRIWTAWNHLRTVSSTIACGLLIYVLSVE